MKNFQWQLLIYRHRSTWDRLATIAILLIGFALRLVQLDKHDLSNDEIFGYAISLRPLGEFIQNTLKNPNPYPIISDFVQSGWLWLTGHSLFALRLQSVWFGLLAIALLFRLGSCLRLRPLTRGLAAFLLAISSFAIQFSQNAPIDTMLMTLTIASVWLAIEWLQRQRLPYAIGYVLCATLALYTDFHAAYILLALYIYVLSRALLYPGLQNSVINLLGPLFFIALFYAPWYEQIVARQQSAPSTETTRSLLEIVVRTLNLFVANAATLGLTPPLWSTIVGVGFLIAILAPRQQRHSAWLLFLYWLVPVTAIWLTTHRQAIFNEHSLMIALPPFYLLLASGLEIWNGNWRENQPTSGLSALPVKPSILLSRATLRNRSAALLALLHASALVLIVAGMLLTLSRYY